MRKKHFILIIVFLIMTLGILLGSNYWFHNKNNIDINDGRLTTIKDGLYISCKTVYDEDNIPNKYDLRDINGIRCVTPLKNQENTELCGAFSTIASLESNVLKLGLSDPNNPLIFSEKQLDYVTSQCINNGSECMAVFTDDDGQDIPYSETTYNYKIDAHDNSLFELGHTKNFRVSTTYFSLGFSPVLESKFSIHDIESTIKIKYSDAFNYNNVDYTVTDTDILPTYYFPNSNYEDEDYQEYLDLIKEYIMTYGALSVSTISPSVSSSGACVLDNVLYIDVDNIEIKKFVDNRGNKVSECGVSTSTLSGHNMTIIGWDDDIEVNYCVYEENGKKTSETMNESSCQNKSGVFYTRRGAWILKNSWGDGDDNPNRYVLLSYNSYMDMIGSVKKTIIKDWDYNYNNTDMDSTSTNQEKVFVKKNNGKAERIVRITIDTGLMYNRNNLNPDSIGANNYDVSIKKSSETSYHNLGVIYDDFYGISSLEIPEDYFIDSNDTFSIQVVPEEPLSKPGKLLVTAFTKEAYKIIYNANGGSGAPENQFKTYDSSITLSNDEPTLNGYTFVGWNTKADGTGQNYSKGVSYSKNEDLMLFAQWTANTYTVTFNTHGGTSVTSQTVTSGNTATEPTSTRAGYKLNGWYTAETGGSKFNFNSAITENKTLHAQWTANTYTVTFNPVGGSVTPTTMNVTYNSTYGTLPTPTKTNFDFKGWYTDETGGSQKKSTDTYLTAGNQTLYARWQEEALLPLDQVSNLTVTDGNIVILGPKVKPSTLRVNEGYTLVYTKGEGKADSDYAGTADTLKLYRTSNPDNYKTYTIIITGDSDGDGMITARDYKYIKKQVMGTREITGVYRIAADVDKDNNITARDYRKIKKYVMRGSF